MGVNCASPRLARRFVTFRTPWGIGMVTTTSCRDGPADELPPPNKVGGLPGPRGAVPGRAALDEDEDDPAKVDERRSRTSNSDPVGPKEIKTSTETGRFTFLVDREARSLEGNRLTSYPARTNFPSGGTKLSSPGLSFHRASRTQGWKTGSSKTRCIACLPPGTVRLRTRSGTPEILEVKAIEPLANAARGRPDGASVTERVSTMSTYSSLLVCRTLARRQGIAGPLVAGLSASCGFNPPGVTEPDEELFHNQCQSIIYLLLGNVFRT